MSHDHHDDHPEHLGHHWETPAQQFEAGKLGMWLFLATEVLLFGGLFCGYAVYRSNHPDLFEYGSQFLDTKWGAINTVVLILSSLTMAAAVTAAQANKQTLLKVLLALTLLGGAGFMAIKYVEYSHKFHMNYLWGEKLYITPADHGHDGGDGHAEVAHVTPDAATGRRLYLATCRACHGVAGEGVPGQGKSHVASEFIADKSDAELIEFIKVGRTPFDPLNTTGLQMPPNGGNPLLDDEDLGHIVAYMRTFGTDGAPVAQDAAADAVIPRSTVPPAAPGPPGLARKAGLAPGGTDFDGKTESAGHEPPDPRTDPNRPANLHIFFGIYFCMTGLHGVHVVAGMAVIAWLLWRAMKGHFSDEYFTPVDLGGLYWHIVDMVWIFLFPLLYLIG